MDSYAQPKLNINSVGGTSPRRLGEAVAESGVGTISHVKDRVGAANQKMHELNDRLSRAVYALHERLVGPQPEQATPADQEKAIAAARDALSRAPLLGGIGSFDSSLCALDALICRFESLL